MTDKFHDYLYGNNFTVYMDNTPLTYVLLSAKLDATGHRWLASLANYNFKLVYRSWKSNGDADGLSRRPQEYEEMLPEVVNAICQAYIVMREDYPYVENLVVNCSPVIVDAVQTDVTSPEGTDLGNINWQQEQMADRVLHRVIELIKSDYHPQQGLTKKPADVSRYFREWKKLYLLENVLYRSTMFNGESVQQLVLPYHFKDTVFKCLYDDVGHQGRDFTLSLVRSRFYWPGLELDVDRKVKSCERCIKWKTVPRPSAELVNIVNTQPMELGCIDFLSSEKSKDGHENILVITDHFTCYAQAFPTRNQLAKTTAKVLFDNYIVHYGFPARLHSDQGRYFETSVIKELCSLAGVEMLRTTPYHPMGNGMVERFNQTLLNMLGTLEDRQK